MRVSEIRALFAVANRPEVVSLAGGMPYLEGLPLDVLGDAGAARRRRRAACRRCSTAPGQGDETLREQILDVMALEGIDAHPDDVVVTTGSQQALDLVTRIFIDPGDVVVAEAPSYVGALGVFRAYQADVVHVPIDADGLIPAALEATLAALAPRGPPRQVPLHRAELPQPGRRLALASSAGPRSSRSRAATASSSSRTTRTACSASTGEPLPAMRSLDDEGVALPRLVLQDLRPRLPRRLGRRAARRAREARAGQRVRDPVPVERLADRDLHLPVHLRLAGPDQDVPRAVPRAARRDDLRARRAPARRVVERSRRRLLHLGQAARGARRQGHAAARRHRPRRLRPGHRVLLRRLGRRPHAAVVLLPHARAHPRGRAPARRRRRRRARARRAVRHDRVRAATATSQSAGARTSPDLARRPASSPSESVAP